MLYKLSDFDRFAVEKPVNNVDMGDLDGRKGRIVTNLLPQDIRESLSKVGGSERNGDYSRQDSALIVSILALGHSPEDVYATFAVSTRGKHAAERKGGNWIDYLNRTIKNAVFHLQSKGFKNGANKEEESEDSSVRVDFGSKSKRKLGDGEEGLIIAMASEIEVEKTQWLWPGYIPSGKITVLAGDPGMGKSTIALDLVARISRGTLLPSGGRTICGTCIVASAEDAPEDTITPRLIVAEADLSRVGLVREVRLMEDEIRPLSLPRDLQMLKKALINRGARVMIIDPFNAFMEKGTDTYKDQDVRMVLAPLESMAEETGAAIVIIAHLNKKEDASTLYRVGGSIGFIGAARSVLAVTNTPKTGVKVLYSLKSNLAKTPPALAYETRQLSKLRKTTKQWLGEETVSSSGIRWKGEVDFDPAKGTGFSDEAKAETEAESFLHQALVDSEVAVNDIYSEARSAGISRTQLNRVKTTMGIKSSKKRDGAWYWRLPSNAE
jgi:hypothetical protein